MRQFIVLGYPENSKQSRGETLYLGADRDKAIEAVNKRVKKYLRKELYELAVPAQRRHFPPEEEQAAEEVGAGSGEGDAQESADQEAEQAPSPPDSGSADQASASGATEEQQAQGSEGD